MEKMRVMKWYFKMYMQQAWSASAPAGPSGSSRARPSGSSPATHVLVSSPTMSQVEEDYVDNNSDENDETYVDVEPDEE
ncbi:unnamed protein product [Linum trigynum]|uniref:Uncharacterized protein n=1 Tax=Linum trigynum TaxID=586398 RepID=A0AAV2GNH2_9ROSI